MQLVFNKCFSSVLFLKLIQAEFVDTNRMELLVSDYRGYTTRIRSTASTDFLDCNVVLHFLGEVLQEADTHIMFLRLAANDLVFINVCVYEQILGFFEQANA